MTIEKERSRAVQRVASGVFKLIAVKQRKTYKYMSSVLQYRWWSH